MTTLNISLPKAMREFIDEQIVQGNYGTASEYIRELLRAAQKQKARERIEALLEEGLSSGEAIEITPEYWQNLRKRLTERYGRGRKVPKRASSHRTSSARGR